MSHRVPVWTTIVLMSRRRVPPALPEQVEERQGGVSLVCWSRYVKLWEQDPDIVLAQGAEGVLPLVGGMNASAEQWTETLERIARIRDREQEKQLYTDLSVWCVINYDEDRIREVARRMTADMKELLRESFREIFRDELQEDRQQMLREGRQEGALEAARQDLEFVVINRFPGLLASERIAGLGDADQVNKLFRALVLAQDRTAAEAAVQRILLPPTSPA